MPKLLKQKQSPPQTVPSTLRSRIEQLRADCDAFIDKKAEEIRQDAMGVPLSSIRQTLTVRYPGDPCRAALAILEKEGN